MNFVRLNNDLVMYYKCLNSLVALTSDQYFGQQHQVSQTIDRVVTDLQVLCAVLIMLKLIFKSLYRLLYNNLPVRVVEVNSVFNFEMLHILICLHI